MLLQAQHIHKRYNSIKAVDGVDLVVRPGENLSIVGESGCGKTTLAKIMMGLVAPDKGLVVFEGRAVGRDQDRERTFRRKVRMVFQDPFGSLDPRFTVRDILKEALCLEDRLSVAEEEKRMAKVLLAVGLSADILPRHPHEFSGGERQRISIARALMTEPSVLVLDEAVSALDVLVQKKILDMLIGLQARLGVTYVFISHNLRAVKKISQRIAVMYQGRIVEYGSRDDIFDRPGHPYTRELLTAAFDYAPSDRTFTISESPALRDIGKGHLVLVNDER